MSFDTKKPVGKPEAGSEPEVLVDPAGLPAYAPNDPAASLELDTDALIAYITSTYPASPTPPQTTLPLPLCLPQMNSGPTSLFVRAYSPVLADAGIPMDVWMHFIDALNLAMAASPPLRVLDAAGMIIGVVPHWWFMVAGIGMQTIARTGMVIVAKTLSDRLLQRTNAEIFGPRGLRVRICRTPAVHQLLGLRGDDGSRSKLKTAAHVAETVALHLPIIRKVYNRIAPSVTPVSSSSSSSSSSSYNQNSSEYPNGVTQRRLAALEGHALPLVFTGLPPPAAPETIMQRAQGMSVRLEQWQARNAQTKADRNRELLAIAEGREPSMSMGDRRPQNERESSWMQRMWEGRQARRLERDAWRVRRKLMRGRQPKSLQSKVQIADRLEYNATQSLLWVVLLTAEQDEAIRGKELLDDPAAVEQIPEEEWNEELRDEAGEQIELKELREEETNLHQEV